MPLYTTLLQAAVTHHLFLIAQDHLGKVWLFIEDKKLRKSTRKGVYSGSFPLTGAGYLDADLDSNSNHDSCTVQLGLWSESVQRTKFCVVQQPIWFAVVQVYQSDWKTGKMGRHFPVRKKSGNFEQTEKVRENHTKYWKTDQAFSLKNKTLKKYWKYQGILSVWDSGNQIGQWK